MYDVSISTGDLITAKFLFNSVISTPGARFFTLDLKNFYLNTKLPEPRYMHTKMDIIPAEIITRYNLRNIPDTDTIKFIPYSDVPTEKLSYMVALSALFARKKQRSIALD